MTDTNTDISAVPSKVRLELVEAEFKQLAPSMQLYRNYCTEAGDTETARLMLPLNMNAEISQHFHIWCFDHKSLPQRLEDRLQEIRKKLANYC